MAEVYPDPQEKDKNRRSDIDVETTGPVGVYESTKRPPSSGRNAILVITLILLLVVAYLILTAII